LATLASTMGLAAIGGGVVVAVHGRLAGLSRYAVGGGMVIVLATAAFVATGSFAFAIVCAAAIGSAQTMHGISAQTLIQSATSGQMIGRVIGLWGMIQRAAPAFGAVIYGVLTEYAGLQVPVLVGCVICALLCLFFVRRLPAMERSLERAEARA